VQAETEAVRVSVLVPIYNVERYLEQCLASICAQSLQELEILCINDGSTDGSLEIIRSFAAQDERIVVIDKPNGGYGQTMNCGLRRARGDYVGIVEADDFIEPEMYELLYNAATAHDAQIVKADFFLTWTTPRPREEYFHAVPPGLANSLVVPYRAYQVMQPQPSIWSALYSRPFLTEHGIDFLESPGASFQDTSFNYEAWSAADRAFLIDRALLHYRQDNANSSINATTKVFAIVEEIDRYFAFLRNYPDREQQLRHIMQGIVYKTFRWNIRRIAPSLREEFLASMTDYFTQAEHEGLLEPEYFEFDFFDELRLLLKNPQAYLAFTNDDEAGAGPGRRLLHKLRREGAGATVKAVARRLFHA
jgi:glycosyltransferase involved in cell wall biosynthesis